MPIEVRCPECQALLRIADENVGRKSRCPNCSHVFVSGPSQPVESQPVESQPAESQPFESQPAESPFTTPLPEPRSPFGPGSEATTNPYAPTYSQAEPQPEPGEFGPRRIDLDDVLSKSWLIFKTHWLMACVAVLVVWAIGFACSMFQGLVLDGLSEIVQEKVVTVGAEVLMAIVFNVFQIWLALGQTMVMLDIARGRPINLSKLFAAGPYLLDGIVATVIFVLVLLAIGGLLIGIPAGIGFAVNQTVAGAVLGGAGGLLLALAPIIVVSLALFLYQPLIVDRKLSGIESLRTSYEITQGNKFTMFLIFTIVAVIGFIAFVIGLLLFCVGAVLAFIGVSGFGALVFVVTYLSMTGQQVVVPGSANDPTSSQYVGTIP